MTIRALIFDVFGTCVDWRTSLAREIAKAVPEVDALAFADAWRDEYDPSMASIRDGQRGYVPLEKLHLENMHRVAAAFGVVTPDYLNSAWEMLDPWPDTIAGLSMMKAKRIIAPCSNGSIAMMTRLSRYGDLPWDCILGADLAHDYKPAPAVYLASCRALRLEPSETMMVAAHNSDLSAARSAGLATAFVPRPKEHGGRQTSDLAPTDSWDIVANDFPDLAIKLNAK